jgi:hypothetical protein
MRGGIWVPVSSEVLGVAFLIAVVIALLYVVFKALSYGVERSEVNSVEERFLSSPDRPYVLAGFGFPASAQEAFSQRAIDADRGLACLKTSGRVCLALCRHAELGGLRLYLGISFSDELRIQAIIHLIGDESRVLIQITPESAMFSHGTVRLFELGSEAIQLLARGSFQVEIGNRLYEPTPLEKNEVCRAIAYVNKLSDADKTRLLGTVSLPL